MKAQLFIALKIRLIRFLLALLMGRNTTPRLLAYVEEAQAKSASNAIVKRGHVHRSIKEFAGGTLSKSELNLVVELAVQLDRLSYQKKN